MPELNPKIFREYDIRGRYPQEIDEKTAYLLGQAFALFLKAKKIVISRDRREESKAILPAFISGVKKTGCRVVDLGINSTPSMFFAVGAKKFDGGVAATASHNPPGYTGLKMCDKFGTPLGIAGLKKVADIAQDLNEPKTDKFKESPMPTLDISPDYWRFASAIIDTDEIGGFNIVLDASNGSGARIADYFFVRIHGKITKMNFKAGDQFADHGLNPMLAKNRKLARDEVKKRKANLGIIWDGDGDRCIFIDDKATFVPPYYINCLLTEIILKRYRKAKLVIDARLPVGLSEIIKKAGGEPIVGRSGYPNIIKLMREKKVVFGCENSGHYFFNFKMIDKKSNYIFEDAIITPLLVLRYLKENGLKLSEAVAKFKKEYPISGEINFAGVDFFTLEKKLLKKYAKNKKEKIDGLSVYDPDWFFNIRPSKTEALVRLNIEAKTKSEVERIRKELSKIIGK